MKETMRNKVTMNRYNEETGTGFLILSRSQHLWDYYDYMPLRKWKVRVEFYEWSENSGNLLL